MNRRCGTGKVALLALLRRKWFSRTSGKEPPMHPVQFLSERSPA
jgi:hypothetical protein